LHAGNKDHFEARRLQQQKINEMKLDEREVFQQELLKLFVALDIPLYKLESPVWKNWAKKNLKFKCADRSHFNKKEVPRLYDEVNYFLRSITNYNNSCFEIQAINTFKHIFKFVINILGC
jgi:hypothetical protein